MTATQRTTGGRCTVRSIYLPGPDGRPQKVNADDQRILAVHPVTGRRVIVRSWKDLRDMEKAAATAGVTWDQMVAVTPRGTDPNVVEIDAALNGAAPEGWSCVVLDSESARGRVYLPWLGGLEPKEPGVEAAVISVERVQLLNWLYGVLDEPGQKELRRLGAAQLAAQLFGDKNRKDLIRLTGDALLRRGPTGRFPDRRNIVTLAALSADLLSADRLADILSWPYAPALRDSAAAGEALHNLLRPLDDTGRWELLEAFALSAYRPYGAGNNDDYDDYAYEDDEHDPRRRYGSVSQLAPSVRSFLDRYTDATNTGAVTRNGLTFENGRWTLSGRQVQRAIARDPDFALTCAAELTDYASRNGIRLPADRRHWGDYLQALQTATTPPPPLRWSYPAAMAVLDGREVTGWAGARFALPAHEEELAEWGSRMGNCIASYGPNVTVGRTLLLAVLAGDTMIANVELRWHPHNPHGIAGGGSWSVREMNGRFNNPLPMAEERILRAELQSIATDLPAPHMASIGFEVNPVALSYLERTAPSFVESDVVDQGYDMEFTERDRRTGRGRRVDGRHGSRQADRPASPDQRRRRAATLAATLVDVAGVVDPELVAEVAGSDDPQSAAQAVSILAALACRSDAPDLAFLTELAAVADPARSWINPRTATAIRDALEEAASTADPAGLAELLTGLEAFPDSPETTGMIARAVEVWASARLADRVVARAWEDRAQVMLPLANGRTIPVHLGDDPQELPLVVSHAAGGPHIVRQALRRLRQASGHRPG